MKRHARLLALLVALVALPVSADRATVTLLNGVTVTGPSAAISAASAPQCGERWFFQLHFGGRAAAAQVVLEGSLDGGTTWTAVRSFTTDEAYSVLATDAVLLRVNVTSCPPGSSVSAFVTASGSLSATVTP